MSYLSPTESKNRVQNIKKKFEVCNTDAPLSTNENACFPNALASSPEISKPKACTESQSNVSSSNIFQNTSNIETHLKNPVYGQSEIKTPISENGREITISHVKGNIRRSPAFRCDKIVKGRNVTGQGGGIRERTYSVVNKRLELFEDLRNGKSVLRKLNSYPVVPSHVSNQVSPHDKGVILKDSSRTKEAAASGLQTTNIRCSKQEATKALFNPAVDLELSTSHSCEKHKVSSLLTVSQKSKTKTPPIPPQNRKPSSKDVLVYGKENESLLQHNGKLEQCKGLSKEDCSLPLPGSVDRLKAKYSSKEQGSLFAVDDKTRLSDTLKAALKAPLPTGPPPKKPPRTFAHKSPHIQMFASTRPKENPLNAKLNITCDSGTHTELSSARVEMEKESKALRTKSESRIMLQKLETVLLSHQQSTGGIIFKPKSPMIKRSMTDKAIGPEIDVISPKPLSRSGPLPSVPQGVHENLVSKPMDLSGANWNCLENLNCVSAGADKSVYSQVHFYEKVPEKQSNFFVDFPRSSPQLKASIMPKQQPKSYGTLLTKSRSVEHIYAEPFEFVKKCSDENKFGSVKKKKSVPSKDDHHVPSAGLHYLCTPLHPETNKEVDMNQTDNRNKDDSNLGAIKTELSVAERKDQNSELHISATDGGKKQPPLLRLATLVKCGQTSGSSDTALCKGDRSKIQLIMNQAFGSPLQGITANASECVSDTDSLVSTPEDGGLIPDLEAISGAKSLDSNEREDAGSTNSAEQQEQLSRLSEERKVYVHRVSSKVYHHTRRNNPTASNFPHLFQCVLLVGLNLDSTNKKIKVPYIKMKYPPDANVPPHIEQLCFPDARDWPPTVQNTATIADEQSYSLVITNDTGERRFGYCRRVLPEGSSVCLPLAYCIISPFRASGFYHKILIELESRHGQPEWLQSAFIKELHSTRFPGPGQTLKFSTAVSPTGVSNNVSIVFLKRPLDSRLEEQDLTHLFSVLQLPVLLQVFSSLLLERKVILFSNSLSQLSSSVEALQSILYPFSWQHTLIPVLPASLLEICLSPTPYIIGILRGKNAFFEKIGPLEESIAVDLDESRVLHCVGDEPTILPARLRRCLKVALQLVATATVPKDAIRNVLVSEAFVRLFVEVCGNYRNHIVTQQDGKKVFERESFIKSVHSHSFQMFLEWFTETAMFSAFIDSRLENDSERDMFDLRALEHSEEMENNTKLFLKNYKFINKKVKTLGDRIKDWKGK